MARDETALLLERAVGPASLAHMARAGCDDEACRILCQKPAGRTARVRCAAWRLHHGNVLDLGDDDPLVSIDLRIAELAAAELDTWLAAGS